MRARLLIAWVATAMAAAALVSVATPSGGGTVADARPMIFVHGFVGSGNQFETQAMRFTTNGYPADHIVAHEYDSTFGSETAADVYDRLDDRIDQVLDDTGADQIDLLGHSLGTGLMQGYLESSPARAAHVAHYVNLDGSPAAALPGGVPTLAVWGRGNDTDEVVGGTNLYFPDQTHTQTVTSAETFAAVFEFFNGVPPSTTTIAQQTSFPVSGRALEFATNFGVDDATLRVYEVDPATGDRRDATPETTQALPADGSWGPFDVLGGRSYEFVLDQGDGQAHHFYFEPFVRENHLLRLLTSQPGQGLDALWERGDGHTNMVVLRNKEWWGDQGADNDSLTIGGAEVMNDAIAPIDQRIIAMFAYDLGSDGVTDTTAPIGLFAGLPFITGVDRYLAATAPPNDSIAVVADPRDGAGPVAVNVPNWASSTDRITVQFNAFHLTTPVPESDDELGDDTTATPAPTVIADVAPATPAAVVQAQPSVTG